MDLSIDMTQEQTLRVSPTLIAVNQILALSSQELQTAIKLEAEENPAFEITEHQTCNLCGEVLKPGIGATNPREWLLLQFDYLKQETGEEPPHVRAILESYFVELGEHKYAYIAQKLGISQEQVEVARDYIRTHLTPYPVMNTDDMSLWGSPSKAQYVSPDVIIREVEGALEVEVVESR